MLAGFGGRRDLGVPRARHSQQRPGENSRRSDQRMKKVDLLALDNKARLYCGQ